MSTVRPKLHDRGNPRLDGVIDFIKFTAKPMPLATLLDEAPQRLVQLLHADICSLYLLEGEHELVMRGNVGFDVRALGQVRLQVGEGITGQAVEYMRPISSAHAEKHVSYRYFDELHEERYPVFLAVPLLGKAGPLGAVVMQRASVPFADPEVEILTALGGLIAAGVRHAELIDSQRERSFTRKAGGGTRKVTLPGRPIVNGRSIGAIAALRRPAHRPSEARLNAAPAREPERDVKLLKVAFDVTEKAIGALAQRARELDLGRDAAFLNTYVEILGDARFRERASEIAASGTGIAQALGQVAREVTRAAANITRDPFLEERARDIEDLCDALTMLAAIDKRAELPSKALLVGDGLTVFDLLISARSHPVGVALSERASGPRTRTLLELMGVPAIVDVQGLFRWASDGDVALIDADHGLIVINPSKTEVAALRRFRKEGNENDPVNQGDP